MHLPRPKTIDTTFIDTLYLDTVSDNRFKLEHASNRASRAKLQKLKKSKMIRRVNCEDLS